MFGLIGHSTSFEEARSKALSLGFPEYAEGDLDMWCSAPPQLVERIELKSPTGQTIEGAYIDSCFVPEMLSRFKTARQGAQCHGAGPKVGHRHHSPGWVHIDHF